MQVNTRLAEEDATGEAGDQAAPKVQWPPPELCPACHKPAAARKAAADAWDEDATLTFLDSFYNPLQLSSASGSISGVSTRSLKSGRYGLTALAVLTDPSG